MSDEVAKARDEQLMAAFAVILTHEAGYGVHLNGVLWIGPTDDGRFRVTHLPTEVPREETFDDVRSAIAYYLDLRDGLGEGYTKPTPPL